MARDTAAAPWGLWPPSSQTSASAGRVRHQRALVQPLQPRRPVHRAQALFDRRVLAPVQRLPFAHRMAQAGDGDGGIFDLVAADQAGSGRSSNPVSSS